MRFQPKSEKEIQEERFPVLKPGKYRFEVTDAKEDISKNGNSMLVLKLRILDESLTTRAHLQDYLMENIAYKLRHAALACGLGNNYDSGELHADQFIGKTGIVDLMIQKDKSGQYPDKNSVKDYIIEQQEQREPGDDWDQSEPPPWMKG